MFKNFKKMPRSTQYLYVITDLAVFFVLILALLLAFWNYYPYKTVEFHGDFQTLQTSYNSGDKTKILVDYCKYVDLQPEVTKYFVDGIVYLAVDETIPLPVGCGIGEVNINIPNSLPSGKYRLKIDVKYQVNPIKSVTVENYSNWFTVDNNDLN